VCSCQPTYKFKTIGQQGEKEFRDVLAVQADKQKARKTISPHYNNNTDANVYCAVIITRPLQEFTSFTRNHSICSMNAD